MGISEPSTVWWTLLNINIEISRIIYPIHVPFFVGPYLDTSCISLCFPGQKWPWKLPAKIPADNWSTQPNLGYHWCWADSENCLDKDWIPWASDWFSTSSEKNGKSCESGFSKNAGKRCHLRCQHVKSLFLHGLKRRTENRNIFLEQRMLEAIISMPSWKLGCYLFQWPNFKNNCNHRPWKLGRRKKSGGKKCVWSKLNCKYLVVSLRTLAEHVGNVEFRFRKEMLVPQLQRGYTGNPLSAVNAALGPCLFTQPPSKYLLKIKGIAWYSTGIWSQTAPCFDSLEPPEIHGGPSPASTAERPHTGGRGQ